MKSDRAETIALLALAHITAREDLLHRFLADSGLDGSGLRVSVADPAMLGGVLDFILADDARVLDFAAEAGLAPEEPLRARLTLSGDLVEGRGMMQ
ncbi:MAG: DUF3572 domain-containing protein [Zavarzinia sp.]|nr:DUF3572 domain-containing protein [Zavarzinia sp.]